MGFNFLDPANIFSGDKGDLVNNSLDPFGGFMENAGIDWGLSDLHNDVGNWMDDLGDANSIMAQERWKNFRKDDGLKRWLQTGDLYASGSPWGTKINNEIYGTDNKPLWDTLGDTTSSDQQAVANRGQDLSNYQGLRQVGSGVGKGFLNAFTFGLGSTATDALDSWGYGDNQSAEDILKNGAKNWALNQIFTNGLDKAGDVIGNSGGYYEQGGGYVGNNEYGGTGGFSLGKEVGAGSATPLVNTAAKGAAAGAIGTAANGGNSSEIGKGALQGGLTSAGQTGASMGLDYLKGLFGNQQPAQEGYGFSPSTISTTPAADALNSYTAENAPAERPYGATPNPQAQQNYFNYGAPAPTERTQSIQSNSSPVQSFIQAITGGGGGQGGGGAGDYADLASSLYGMYNARKQRNQLKQQQQSLQDLFSPNSPYAQMARQRMERTDAAAGRRSQYGPREMQLAALLADRQASTFPQQQKYSDAIGGYDNQFVNAGFRGFNQGRKLLPGLLQMFQGE